MKLPLRLPEPGPLLAYISWLSKHDPNMVQEINRAVRECLNTPSGRILLELLDKSLEKTPTGILEDHRALAARNAQCFIASDFRRILSNETEQILEQQAVSASAGRAKRRRG